MLQGGFWFKKQTWNWLVPFCTALGTAWQISLFSNKAIALAITLLVHVHISLKRKAEEQTQTQRRAQVFLEVVANTSSHHCEELCWT